MDQPTILIVSDDAAFSGAITARWQAGRTLPAFTMVSGDLCHGLDPDSFVLAIVGGVRSDVLNSVIKVLGSLNKPVIFVSGEGPVALGLRQVQQQAVVLRQNEGWLDTLVQLATEILRRCEALSRADHAEQARVLAERQATLGRFVLEMRHNLNNALTSVLGNSELLLQEPGSLSSAARSQIETIRNMSLRMHEILQRFSSLEKELSVAASQAETEKAHAIAAGY